MPDKAATLCPAMPVLQVSHVTSGSYLLWQSFDLLFRAAGEHRSYVQQHPIQHRRDAQLRPAAAA